MGWSSGTEIFDPVVKKILNAGLTDKEKTVIIKELIVRLTDADWDTECESLYFEHPLVKKIFKKLNPEWDWSEADYDYS
jgi:hypothetical protein